MSSITFTTDLPLWRYFRNTLLWLLLSTTAVASYGLAPDKNPALSKSSTTKELAPAQWEDGSNFIVNMCHAADNLGDYEVTYMMQVYKNKVEQERGIIRFHKPNQMRVDVLSGSRKGACAIRNSDGTVKGHLGGFLRLFSSTVASDSPLARCPNGYPMAGSDFHSLTSYLHKMIQNDHTSRATTTPIKVDFANEPLLVLEIFSKNVLVKRIFVSPHTYLPVGWQDFRNNKLFSFASWHNLKTPVSFTPNTFKM